MVIRILQSTSNLEAVNYSEEKIEKNEAKLIKSANFPFENMSAKEHKNYLESLGRLNPRVQKKQFHASISTKGRQHTFEELTQVAERYIKHMGYKDNPYIIYAHHDSPNNHVHIVSSRVNLQGRKISDSLEKNRTQEFILNDLKINFSADVSQTVDNALSYSLSTPKQFETLLAKQGYQTALKQDTYHIYKSGSLQHTVSKERVQNSIRDLSKTPKQMAQTKAFLHKYSQASSYAEIKSALHQNFGMELIWHYPKKENPKWTNQKLRPFGYTVFDHKNKTAYKGSQLVLLKKLEDNFKKDNVQQRSIKIQQLLTEDNHMSLKEFKKTLSQNGLFLKSQSVFDKLTRELCFHIPDDRHQLLSYYQRVANCKALHCSGHITTKELSNIFKIDPIDVEPKVGHIDSNSKRQYRNLFLHYKAIANNVPLKENKLHIFKHQGQSFLFDIKAKVLLNLEKDLDLGQSFKYFKPRQPQNKQQGKTASSHIYFDKGVVHDQPSRKKKSMDEMDIQQTL